MAARLGKVESLAVTASTRRTRSAITAPEEEVVAVVVVAAARPPRHRAEAPNRARRR